MPFTKITVTFTFNPVIPSESAEVIASLSGDMSDGLGIIAVAGPRMPVVLDVNGHGSILLEANDDSTTRPTGRYWAFSYLVNNQTLWVKRYVIPSTAANGTIDLAQLAPVDTSQPLYTYIQGFGKMTVSPTPPPSPAVNDIWINTSN